MTERSAARAALWFDVLVTAALCAGWVWFAYQYGFSNSPDSWYRGVLAKSIAEGHPYWVNVKQGYAYEYGVWHHDATHEPFLPFLYAVSFLVFGTNISVANVICALSAGLLWFAALRLSRALTGSAWPGVVVYIAIIFTEQLGYLFELNAGLAIPTALLTFVLFAWCLARLVETEDRRWIIGTAIAAASYYHVRPESPLIFWGLLVWTLLVGRWMLTETEHARLRRMWVLAFLFVLPWMLRKAILFGNPLFTHMTPLMWTDRGYDYFSYHESMPFPTPASYFKTHVLGDLARRVFVKAPADIAYNFYQAFGGSFWGYVVAAAVAAAVIVLASDRRQRFVFLALWVAGLGYLGVLSLTTILDTRYLIPLCFIIAFTLAAAPFMVVAGYSRGVTRVVMQSLLGAVLLGALLWSQRNFWATFRSKYLRRVYQTSDQRVRSDPLVQALRARFTPEDVILGPFSEVQYLSFATGLTFVELPDNLKMLNDPVAFFQKFGIRYALVDVGRVLPKEMIEKVEILGNRPLYTIGNGTGHRQADFFAESNLLEDGAIAAAVANGVRNRVVYIDAYHGAPPPEMAALRDAGLNPFAFPDSLVESQQKLFQSGVLLLQYANGMRSLGDDELAVVKRFVANGGRVALFCPAWVFVAYERRPLEELSCFKIANLFGVLLTGEYVDRPYTIVEPALQVPGLQPRFTGTFSGVLGVDMRPVLVGKDDHVAAATAEAGKARLLAWGQNNLFSEVAATPEGRQFVQRLFDWLVRPN